MEFVRFLNLDNLLKKKSYFLFGPRATGKTTLIRKTLSKEKYPYINLLNSETRLTLLKNPSDIRRMIPDDSSIIAVVIDEIQKIPELLDEVHDLIEEKGLRFLLTGSSARKLKRCGANLLAGRARILNFFPLTYPEIMETDMMKRLHMGSLPGILTSDEPWQDLRAYVDTYLKEEIEQEAQVRNLGSFARFLSGAAMNNGELLNYASVASDAGVPETTVRGYYQILSDTLIGSILEPYRESKKRKAIQTAKFYFFDTGVTHAILNLKTLDRSSSNYVKAVEQLIHGELKAYIAYHRIDEPLNFWRSVNKQEVDFVIGGRVAIEVKSKKRVVKKDLSGLRALAEEGNFEKLFLISHEENIFNLEGVKCMPHSTFLHELWAGNII